MERRHTDDFTFRSISQPYPTPLGPFRCIFRSVDSPLPGIFWSQGREIETGEDPVV